MAIPIVGTDCIGALTETELLQQLILRLNELQESGTGTASEYTSTSLLADASGEIPAGVLGWGAIALSGTITVNGAALAAGARVQGGGYGSSRSSAAIPYTVAGGGSVLITYDL